MRRGIACASLLCLSGCGLPNFDPPQYVNGLRVLAIQAEPPEAAPGETTHLTPLAVDLDGSPIAGTWEACTEGPAPGGPPVNPGCLAADPQPYLLPLGDGLSIDATVPAIGRGAVGIPDASDGVYLALRLHASDASDALDAVYRLRIANGLQPRNHNPAIAEVDAGPGAADSGTLQPLVEGTPLIVRQGDQISLVANFAPADAETYPVIDTEGKVSMVTEQLTVDWFATAGSFDHARTGDGYPATFTADVHLPASGATIDLWAVGRDERGGAGFTHRQLQLQ